MFFAWFHLTAENMGGKSDKGGGGGGPPISLINNMFHTELYTSSRKGFQLLLERGQYQNI